MIVKYARERIYVGEGKDPHFSLGSTYMVFGMTFCLGQENKPAKITLLSDMEKYPGAWDFCHFDIVDDRLPSDWVFCNLETRGIYRLCPLKFTGNFWDHFHDGDETAEKTFNEVSDELVNFHGFGESA